MTSKEWEEELDHISHLLKGHKCRIDSRKPAGGPVCDTCQAEFAVENLRNKLLCYNKGMKVR